MATDIDGVAAEIAQAVKDYTDDVKEAIEEEVKETADRTKDDIADRSPRDTGEYADGWSRRKTGRGDYVQHTVYNKEKPHLVHLLEFGHANRDGSRTPGQPHINPAIELHVNTLDDRIADIVEKGGR